MSEAYPWPFPTALLLDASFLRTIGGTESDAYQTFIQYVKAEDVRLYLTPGVVEEVSEQRGYISIDWVDRAGSTLNTSKAPASSVVRLAPSGRSPARATASSYL
jgi:hypothetical protein